MPYIELNSWISIWIYRPFLLFIFALTSFKFFQGKISYALFVYIGVGFIMDIVVKLLTLHGVLFSLVFQKNLTLAYFLISYIAFSSYCYSQIEIARVKKWVKLFTALISILIIFSILFWKLSYTKHNQITIELVCVYFIITSLFFYIDFFLRNHIIQLKNYAAFWFMTGIFFWSIFFLFRVGAMYYLQTYDPILLLNITSFFVYINLITYTIYLKGLVCLR